MGKKRKSVETFNPLFKDQPPTIPKKAPVERPPDPPKKPELRDDKDVFLQAVSDVRPLTGNRGDRHMGRATHIRPPHPAPDEDQEVLEHLHSLVRGDVEMDITFSDEYIEGSVRGFSRRIMKRLKRGEIPVQDHIDLHGFTKAQAEERVRDFILRSHRLGMRCVLIVHGRGLNSPDSFPVLKEGIPVWLGRGPAKRIVLAFVTARPYDGGTGALYVLLRK